MRIDHRSNCYKIGVRSRLKSGYGYSAFEFNARRPPPPSPALFRRRADLRAYSILIYEERIDAVFLTHCGTFCPGGSIGFIDLPAAPRATGPLFIGFLGIRGFVNGFRLSDVY